MDQEQKRLILHRKLLAIEGPKAVYYQPPPTVKMVYPCIRYTRSRIIFRYANGRPYKEELAYQLIVIDTNPDSNIVSQVASLPYCRHESHYTADGLHHDAFTIYNI